MSPSSPRAPGSLATGQAHSEKRPRKSGEEEPDTTLDNAGPLPRSPTPTETEYPEGGWRAWGVVVGSWCALFGSMSIMNSIGTFQAYLLRNQLSDESSVSIGWIFGVYNGLAFLLGVQAGPIFDARGPRELIFCGGFLTVLYLMLLGLCSKYWHFMLVFGVLGGLSLSMIYGPAIAIVAHYFNRRRGLATGIASSGGAVGGIVFPLMLQTLFERVGFAWATRAAGFMCLGVFTLAVSLIRPRSPPKPLTFSTIRPDLTVFRHAALTLTSFGVFFLEWGLFIPFSYITSYALDHGSTPHFAYMLLSLLNAGGVFGRCIPGYYADRFGRFNILMLTVSGCLLSLLCLWLPANSSQALLIVFSLLFGFFSGSNVSLAPVCIGQLCKLGNYGRYYSTAYTLVSIGMFTGTSLGGRILETPERGYLALILFAAGCYLASLTCLALAKLVSKGKAGLWATF